MQVKKSVFTSAVFDFLLHLMQRKEPLIVGANYPRNKVIQEFENWAKDRYIDTETIDLSEWNNLCKSGLLK